MGWRLIFISSAVPISTYEAASCQRLRSVSRHQLIMPRHRHRRTCFTGRRAFSVADPMAWNSLPDYLCDTLLSEDTFRRSLKTHGAYLSTLY